MSRDYPALFVMPVTHSEHTLRRRFFGFPHGNCAVLQDSVVPDTLQTYSVSLSSACGFAGARDLVHINAVNEFLQDMTENCNIWRNNKKVDKTSCV